MAQAAPPPTPVPHVYAGMTIPNHHAPHHHHHHHSSNAAAAHTFHQQQQTTMTMGAHNGHPFASNAHASSSTPSSSSGYAHPVHLHGSSSSSASAAPQGGKKRKANGNAAKKALNKDGEGAAAAAAMNGKRKMTPMAAFRPSASSSLSESASASTSTAAAAAGGKKKSSVEKFKRNSRACTYCQRLKMKCSGPTADGPCERCRRTGKECMVQERAPRRPWTKKKDMQIQQLTDRLEEMESMLRSAMQGNEESAVALGEQMINNGIIVPPPPAALAPVMTTSSSTLQAEQQQQQQQQQPKQPRTKAGPSPGAINNWISLTNAPTTPSSSHELDLAYVDAHREQLPFVSSGKVSAGEAVEMFHLFINSCSLHTVILDPEWHTIPRVGDASPFLFGVILYIAATYHRERRSLRHEMHDEMNILVGQVITSGPKSVEVVQGFLLLYQWNSPSSDPEDDRAWLLSGIAIRLATEMQLHKAQRRVVATNKTEPVSTRNGLKDGKNLFVEETDRERINRERCWIMAFAVDRSLSFALGRSWTISEKAELVRDTDKWFRQPASRPWDQGISAFADLLKTTSRQADVLHTAVSKWDVPFDEQDEEHFDCDTMMRIMNDELETWRRRWLSRDFFALTADISPEAAANALMASGSGSISAHDDSSSPTSSSVTVHTEALDVHLRTLYYITKQASFRYNFAVLVLNCFGLQYCTSRPKLTHARTYCVTHAVRAAQGLVKAATDGLRTTMTYAPHTQFTILSFGIVTLIKLAPLVDEVIAARLIDQVRNCVSFLESIAIASDHTPARLASLVRTMLRARDQRLERRKNDEDGQAKLPARQDVKTLNGGSETKAAAASEGEEAEEEEEGEPMDGDENGKRNVAFAPGMEVHKLPQRSSRAVTPEAVHDSQMADIHSWNAQNGLVHETSSSFPHPSSDQTGLEALQQQQQQQQQNDQNAAHLWPSNDEFMSTLSTFDPEMEATLQSLGITGNIGTAGWSHMSAEEILDDSFWLRLPDRGGSGTGSVTGNIV